MEFLTKSLMFLTATFLILLVLVQRGRGGGLAGALGGMGGQSAFGTKAGDLFTRITIGVAAVWIVLSCFAVWYFSAASNDFSNTKLGTNVPPVQTAPATSGAPAGVTEPAKKAAPVSTPDKAAPVPESKASESKASESKAATPDAKAAVPESKAAAPASDKPADPAKK